MITGTNILAKILGKTGASREAILTESVTKNLEVPNFFNTFFPVHAHGKDTKGDDVVIEFMVATDYLCIGTDMDFLRIPLLPNTAQKIADARNCLLPTKHMVDMIYEQASIKLYPQPYAPKIGDPGREDSRAYGLHNKLIQTQIGSTNTIGLLLAGHKKDIVITNQLLKYKKHVAIYGWHQKNGIPIQGLNARDHGDFYVDYSHGVRLISMNCRVNGVQMNLEDVLKSKDYGPILTGDEPLLITRYVP